MNPKIWDRADDYMQAHPVTDAAFNDYLRRRAREAFAEYEAYERRKARRVQGLAILAAIGFSLLAWTVIVALAALALG